MSTVYENMPAQRYQRYEQAKEEVKNVLKKHRLLYIDATMLLESLKYEIIRNSLELELELELEL